MPNGFMVLDYDATPEMGNIYADEKHGYQMVIRDVSRAEAKRVCNVLNEKDDAIIRLEKENKELKRENEQLSVMKSNGLKVLEFYTYKLKNADKKEFDNAREELWIVKEVLSEMGVIKND